MANMATQADSRAPVPVSYGQSWSEYALLIFAPSLDSSMLACRHSNWRHHYQVWNTVGAGGMILIGVLTLAAKVFLDSLALTDNEMQYELLFKAVYTFGNLLMYHLAWYCIVKRGPICCAYESMVWASLLPLTTFLPMCRGELADSFYLLLIVPCFYMQVSCCALALLQRELARQARYRSTHDEEASDPSHPVPVLLGRPQTSQPDFLEPPPWQKAVPLVIGHMIENSPQLQTDVESGPAAAQPQGPELPPNGVGLGPQSTGESRLQGPELPPNGVVFGPQSTGASQQQSSSVGAEAYPRPQSTGGSQRQSSLPGAEGLDWKPPQPLGGPGQQRSVVGAEGLDLKSPPPQSSGELPGAELLLSGMEREPQGLGQSGSEGEAPVRPSPQQPLPGLPAAAVAPVRPVDEASHAEKLRSRSSPKPLGPLWRPEGFPSPPKRVEEAPPVETLPGELSLQEATGAEGRC